MNDPREDERFNPALSERVPVLPLGLFGRAYLLSRGQRMAIAVADVLWGLLLIIAVTCGRFELLSVLAVLAIMVAIIAFRFVAIKAYLIALRAPASDTPLGKRAQMAYDGFRGPIEGAMRTLSIASGAGLAFFAVLIAMYNKLFSVTGALVIGGLAALFAAAVAGDVLVHRYYARRANSTDQSTQS